MAKSVFTSPTFDDERVVESIPGAGDIPMADRGVAQLRDQIHPRRGAFSFRVDVVLDPRDSGVQGQNLAIVGDRLPRSRLGEINGLEWHMAFPRVSAVCSKFVFVVHLMADGDRRPSEQFDVSGGTGIVGAKRPLAIFVECQGDAANAPASRPYADALKAYGFKFLNGLLCAVHSSLLSASKAKSGYMFQQGRAA